MAPKLPNYLRTYRKRAYLTQDEMAFLLGTESGTRVSRYERYGRSPGLETAFAYEVIFAASHRQLFGGIFERIEEVVRKRADELVARLERRAPTPVTRHKLAALRSITSPSN